jgi:hypothetical protein
VTTADVAADVGKLSKHGKFLIAMSMYQKGKAFLGASILLRKHDTGEATEYVALHIFCQGLETLLKGLLLLHNYGLFQPRLIKLGHRLPNLIEVTSKIYKLKPMSAPLLAEVTNLGKFYATERLRYGSGIDIFISPHSIESKRIQRRIYAVIRLSERQLSKYSLP